MNTAASYDIVVATADRPDMLRISIPTFMAQKRAAERLIIVDASDDHQKVVEAVRAVTSDAPIDVHVIPGPRSASRQRNLGVEHVNADVVFFPDDDSLWYPDVAERVMAIYDRDRSGKIGGVGQHPASRPPFRLSEDARHARAATLADRMRYRLAQWRVRARARVLKSPLASCGEALLSHHSLPTWLDEVNAVPIPFQIGFRMSFRAASIRRHPFSEVLHPPRCGLEDCDASFSVLHEQLLVEAKDALVYHHKVGGRRGNGLEMGLTQLLNQFHIVCRHAPPGSEARNLLRSNARSVLIEAIARAPMGGYERDKLVGLWRAYRSLAFLLDSPAEELDMRYREAVSAGLGGRRPSTVLNAGTSE